MPFFIVLTAAFYDLRFLALNLSRKIWLRMQIMIELRRLFLNDSMLQLDMPLQSGFRAIATIASSMGALHFIENVFIAPPLKLFCLFGLPSFDFTHVLEQFKHSLMFCLGLLY